jgi:hypothetical protein
VVVVACALCGCGYGVLGKWEEEEEEEEEGEGAVREKVRPQADDPNARRSVAATTERNRIGK